MPIVTLNDGRKFEVVTRPGESDDDAAVAFMRQNNSSQPLPPPQPTPDLQAGRSSVMDPNGGPSWADQAQDWAKSLLSAPGSAIAGMSSLPAKVPVGLLGIYQNFVNGQVSPGLKQFGGKVTDAENEMRSKLGGDYDPHTNTGRYLKSLAGDVTGSLMTGGTSLPDLALAAASGLTSQAGQDMAGTAGGFAGAAAPFLGRAAIRTATPAGNVFATGRDAMNSMSLGELEQMRQLEASATANGVPSMAWQNAPAQSTLRNAGSTYATKSGAKQIQENLRDLQGGVPAPGHATADQLQNLARMKGGDPLALGSPDFAPPQPSGVVGDPEAAQRLAQALRETDVLRGKQATSEAQGLGKSGHEFGGIALATDVLEHIAPSVAKPAAAVMGAGEFARTGFLKSLLDAPARKAADELFGSSTEEEFRRKMMQNPKRDALTSLFRAATTAPASTGNFPSYSDQQGQ
jgi:hypothetical protein